MRRLTHDEFVKIIAETNPDVKIVGTYVNRETKISISCRKCGKIIDVYPQNLFSHSGMCRDCSIAESKGRAAKTHEEFESELKKSNPNIILTGRYVNATTPIEWKCRLCGISQYSRPGFLMTSSGYCKSCCGRITHEEFVRRIAEKNPSIQIVGEFVDSKTPIEWKCNRCGKIALANPKLLSKLSGTCKQCQFEAKKEAFYKDYKALRNPPILLTQYDGATKKILCQCSICGHEWSSLPSAILTYKTPCPKCSDDVHRIRREDFVAEMVEVNPNIEILGKYHATKEPVLCRCKLCNNEWTARPQDLKKGKGCPECNHSSTSFVEQLVLLSLREVFGSDAVLSRDRKAINKELDIYIPSKNLAVEFGAWYWHKDRVLLDQEKVQKCEDNGIYLLCIYDTCREINEINISQFKKSCL